jgi:hypothetical protein
VRLDLVKITVAFTMRFPDKSPTPSEYAVIAVAAAVALIGYGVIAVCIASRGSADHPTTAAALASRGWWFIGIGTFVAVAYWVVRRFTT